MRHDLHQIGMTFALRPVALADSEAIVQLRRHPERSRHIHPTSADPADQQAWIERYFQREGDYYFIIESVTTKSLEGTISIYDLDCTRRTAEWGRWILRPDSLAAVESVLLLYRIAFECLDLETLFCRTVTENQKVVSFHTSCGLQTVGVRRGIFTLGDHPVDAVEQCLTRAHWPMVEARLTALAARTSRLLNRKSVS